MKREINLTKQRLAAYLIICQLLAPMISIAQDLKQVKETIQTLASPQFHGRGYIHQGDSLAAAFIKSSFEKIGGKPLGDSSYQYFRFPINTFPEELELFIGGEKIIPGQDFIVSPGCGSIHGTFKIIRLDSALIVSETFKKMAEKKKFSKSALWFDKSAQKALKQKPELLLWVQKAGLRLEDKTKLTASLAQKTDIQPIIWINSGVWKPGSNQIKCQIKNQFIPSYKSQNVIFTIPGTAKPDSFLVVSAHYDHLGRMGPSVYFPGANDNASGISMLLELTTYYAKFKPKYSIVFIAFGGEEAGLIGSKYFVEHPLIELSKIKFLLNLDLIGTGDDGIQVVNSTIHTKEFNQFKSINDSLQLFSTVKTRGKAANSDHYYFSEAGVPSFFIYTLGGITAYHDIYDTSEKLPLTKYKELFQLITKSLDSF